MSRVTIGIPTYRRPALLRRALASALAQDHADLEIVISDNASGDETGALCRAAAATDPRVRYLAQPVNVGPVPNFRAALDAGTGEYFMWLGDDDWLEPTYVSRCVARLARSPEIAAVAGVAQEYKHGEPIGPHRTADVTDATAAERIAHYYRIVHQNTIFYGVMRRATLAACTLPNTLGGDWLLMAQLAARGHLVIDEGAVFHRERASSTSRSIASIVRTLRLPRIQEMFPAAAIAGAAARDVLLAEAYDGLSAPERTLLAARVAAILTARLGVWAPLRRALTPVLGPDRARRWKTAVAGALEQLRR